MPRSPRSPGLPVALLAVLLMSVALTGCIGDDDGDSRFSSYEDAKEAVVQTYEPVDRTSSVRLGLISPEDPSQIATGGTDVVVLLYDSETDEPITDAAFEIEAFMPQMGHGTDPETNPSHEAHGVYVGSTTITMGGTWEINLDPMLADGTTLEFDVEVQAGGDGGMDGGMDDGNTTGYASYQEAQDAPGEVLAPNQTDSSVRIKLLEPDNTTDVRPGMLNLTLLLFDEEADEPVENATVTLEAWMPAMGHGTSPEVNPEHGGHGVYQGLTNLMMNGTWILRMTAETGDGTNLTWSIDLQVGQGGMDMEPPEGYAQTHEDSVSDPSYEQNWTFEIAWTPAQANLTLAVSGTPLGSITDELTLTVLDPDGAEIDSITVSGGSNATLEITAFEGTGNHTAQITGQGVESSYTLDIEVGYLSKTDGHDHGAHDHG